MDGKAMRRRRVLIAAYMMPKTVEFQFEEDQTQSMSPQRTYASPSKHAESNTERLADLLTSSLNEAMYKEQAHARVFPGTQMRMPPKEPPSRRLSFPTTRERVNMAELMADAAGSGTANLHPLTTAHTSGTTSPYEYKAHMTDANPMRPRTVAGFPAASASVPEEAPSDSAPIDTLPHRVKNSLSDHGRRADADVTIPRAPAMSSHTPSSTMHKAPFVPHSTSPHTLPSSASMTPRTSEPNAPISIISDLKAKSYTMEAQSPPENPYGLGSRTPAPPIRPSKTTVSSTPRLMVQPDVVPTWADGKQPLDSNNARHASESELVAGGATPAAWTMNGHARDHETHANSAWRHDVARPVLARMHWKGGPSQNGSESVSRNASRTDTPPPPPIPFEFLPCPGANYGLINAVNSEPSLNKDNVVYIGTLGIEMDWVPQTTRDAINTEAMREHGCLPVWLRDIDYVKCYHHYCKQILWPTFHYTLPSATGLEAEHDAFRAYVEVNRRFAERIVEEYREGDVVWVQDYHLLLVPSMVREMLPRAPIGLFVHIAFPSSEIFRCLSRREELLRGMLGADLVGFQTHNFCLHFRQTVNRILQLPTTARGVALQRSFVAVAPFPIGIDVHVLNRRREHPDVREWVDKLTHRFAGRRVLVGRDKLDWIKGVREKLIAFELFLDRHPEWVGKVVLVQVALATVQENGEVGDVSDIVSRINHKHSSLTYQPVVFLHVQEITFSQYLALLTMADAFVATSLREGMNLTTHEYIMAQEQRKRPLILSEFTGTYSALRACIGINPFNAAQVARAIELALTMPADEMAQRWEDLHRTVASQTAQHWVTSVLSQLEHAHLSQPSPNTLFTPRLEIAQMQAEWRIAKTRLVLLDLEHTLVGESPMQLHENGYEPPQELVNVLRRLTNDKRNYVYLLSHKSTTDLDALARAVPAIGVIAENGCYVQHCVRTPDGACEWTSLVDGIDMDWRISVREILEYFTERTPGSWIDEQSAIITWYFCEGTCSPEDAAWARRQASEVQSLISDSLGERFSLQILHAHTHFVIMPKNIDWTAAVQYMLALNTMGSLPLRTTNTSGSKGLFEFVLYIGRDAQLISHLNELDLPLAPRTCTTAGADTHAGSVASCQVEAGKQVHDALEEIIDFHLRDLKWGGPATMDV